MNLIQRRANEAVVIGEDTLMTVEAIDPPRAKIALTTLAGFGRFTGRDDGQGWVQKGEAFVAHEGVRCTVMEVERDWVRVGFDDEVAVRIVRKEAYDALKQ